MNGALLNLFPFLTIRELSILDQTCKTLRTFGRKDTNKWLSQHNLLELIFINYPLSRHVCNLKIATAYQLLKLETQNDTFLINIFNVVDYMFYEALKCKVITWNELMEMDFCKAHTFFSHRNAFYALKTKVITLNDIKKFPWIQTLRRLSSFKTCTN